MLIDTDRVLEKVKDFSVGTFWMIILGIFIFLTYKWLGSSLFSEEGEAVTHITDMLIFGGVGLVVLFIIFIFFHIPVVQKIVLPHEDELVDMTKIWRGDEEWAGRQITTQDCYLAIAFAINSGLRILAVMIAIAMLATPL